MYSDFHTNLGKNIGHSIPTRFLYFGDRNKPRSTNLNLESVEFTVNGKLTQVSVKPKDLLSEILRDRLGLLSNKIACNEGTCGSCTILLDGEPVYSCLILALDCDEKSVDTLEGLSKDGRHLHPIQESFLTTDSAQCGFCTPGIIMSAKSLLDKNPEPTEDEVKIALSGNVCRCTDYSRYIDAVLLAAKQMRNQAANA